MSGISGVSKMLLHSIMISVPKEKLCKISQEAYHLLHEMTVSVKDLARFVRKAVATV